MTIPIHKSQLLTYLLLLLIVSCTQSPSLPTVSFSVFGDPAEFAAYQALVEAFHTQHPDIEIQLQHTPSQSQYRQRLATTFANGSPPDVMLLNYRRFATFAGQGGLTPLEPFLAESDIIQEADFFPTPIEAFHLDGQLWCIPQNVSSLVVYYNKDLFDAANLPYPTDDWTWDDFLTTAQALTRPEQDQYGVGLAPNLFRLAPFIWQNGGTLVDDPTNPTRLTLHTPPAREALQWFIDLQLVHHVVPDQNAEAIETSESRFLNGRLGMIFNSRRGVPTYRTIQTFQWDVAALPVGLTPAGILHSDAYCLSAKTEHPQAAWAFIEFANSITGQTIVVTSGRTVPSLVAVANSPTFLNPTQSPANSRVYIDTIPILGRVPIMPTWTGIEEAASKEIERAFYGTATLDEAIDTANQLTAPYFEP